jgi:DNA modification methylase
LDYEYKHEPILYAWNKRHKFYGGGTFKNSVWDIPKPKHSDLHPTMKPVALVENAILNSSIPGGLVLDMFAGSGTTAIAAERTQRRAYLMELDPAYCDVIVTRWEQFTGQKAQRLPSPT